MYKIKTIFSDKNRFLIKYYLLLFLRGIFLLKIYATIMLDDILTPIQASSVISIYSLVSIITIIPMNCLSEKLGLKRIMILAETIYIASYIVLLYSKNTLTFSLYYGSYALHSCVFNSVLEILIYGNIKHFGLKTIFSKYRNISKIFRTLSTAIATYIAGIFVYKNKNMLYFCDIVILLSIITIIFTIDERKKEGNSKLNKNSKKLIYDSFKYIFKHKVLRNFIIFQAFWNSMISMGYIYRSLFCEEIAINDSRIGLMLSIQTIVVAIIQLIFTKYLIKQKISTKSFMFVIGCIFYIMSTYYYKGIWSYIFYTLFFIFIQFGENLTYSKMISFIPDRLMPIILSIFILLSEFYKFLLLHIFGYIAHYTQYKTAFIYISILFTVISYIGYIFTKYNKHLLKNDK